MRLISPMVLLLVGVGAFASHIVVGHGGFIYVADMGNQRIQKFSP